MPVRIYALAKELKVDSKQLVDICAKAGVTGKGSALASLTDEEEAKVRAFVAGGGRAPSKAPTAKSSLLSKKSGEKEALTRDTAYSGSSQKEIKVLSGKPKRDEAAKQEEVKRPPEEKKKPAPDEAAKVKLAPMPATSQPAPPPEAPEEPAAQQPTIRLPKDAIQKAKHGGRLDEIREQAEKKRKKDDRGKAAKPEPAPAGKAGRRDGRGRGKGGEDGGLADMASHRRARQDRRRTRSVGAEDEQLPRRRSRRPQRRGPVRDTAAPRKEKVVIELPCSVRQFSEAAGVSAMALLRPLMQTEGMAVNINSTVDFETAEQLVLELELDNVELKEAVSLEDEVLKKIRETEDPPEALQPRPPVITFLGHVDHGKTSLLDKIINIDVVSGEAGGITQHIRAYSIKKDGRPISFVDTPGHEAFTEMRARGANVTDIAVLVVAADDGVMPQTEEAISHARAAGVPIVVAMNKIDLPGANPDRVLQQLSQHELLPAEWGGDVEVIKTSAITGEGIDDLLETLLLTAEIHEYQANPDRNAYGVCLEAEQEPGRGVVAKFIVKGGTMNVGDVVVCGSSHGRIKAMYDTLRPTKKRKQAGPSMPVNITGLDIAPVAGETFYVLEEIAQAREIAERRADQTRQQALVGKRRHFTFEEFQQRLAEGRLGGGGEPAELNLIIRADVQGSIEAIQKELSKLDHPEVKVKILQASVGGITVGDVTLAAASEAVIVGFNVIPDEVARSLADDKGVEIRRYDVIYRITNDVKDLLEGKLTPEEHVKDIGRAVVKQTFQISRVGTIAGCHVLDGVIQRGCRIRVNREGRGIGDYPLGSLRREKDDVREVRKGYECGMKLDGFNDLKEGDILEAYKIEEVKRELVPMAAGAGE